MRKQNYEIVLRRLEVGGEVTLELPSIYYNEYVKGPLKVTIGMDEDGNLLQKLTKYHDGIEEDVWYVFDISFNNFKKMCANMSEDEVFLIGASTALTEMAQEKSRKRNDTFQTKESDR